MANHSTKLDFILRLNDMVSAPLAKVRMGFSELAEKGQQNIKGMGIGLAGMVGAGVAITQAMQPALEMNRALADVRSLGVAEDALDALNKKALSFSVAYGENAQAFVASAYQVEGAIKGLTGSQLATFTHASNVLAKATKADAATMTSYVGTMYNLHKNQADAMGKGAWVNALAGQTALAVQLFRTSGEQIGEAFNAAGGLASTAGVSLAEQMAVLGTAASTMDAGTAGGAYKAFFENVGSASERLGMSFTDSTGRLLPMLDIVEQLKGRFGDLSVAANANALSEAFGGEAAMLLTRLMGDTDRLRNGMDKLGQVRGLEAAERMAKGMVDPWQQFAAAVQALRIAIGQALMPILTPLMERLTGIASTITRWTGLFPNITRAVGLVALAVLGMAGAIGAVTFAVALAKTAWLAFSTGLLVNPLTWIVIGVVAVIAAVTWLTYKWDTLTAAFANTTWFQALVTVLTPVVLLFRVFGALLGVLWDGLVAVVTYGSQFVAWLLQLEAVTTAAKTIWDGFVWALTNISPFALLGDAIKGLIGLLNKIPGVNIETSFGDTPQIPGADMALSQTGQNTLAPAIDSLPAVLEQPAQVLQVEPALGALPTPALPKTSLGIATTIDPLPAVPEIPAQALRIEPTMGALPAVPEMPAQPLLVEPAMAALAAPAVPEARLDIATAIDPLPAVPEMPEQPLQIEPAMGTVGAPVLPEATLRIATAIDPLPAVPEMPAAALQIEPAVAAMESDQPASLSPERPTAVPKGGLLSSIQNTTHNQSRGTHVEKVEIHTGKDMSPLALESMLSMAVG